MPKNYMRKTQSIHLSLKSRHEEKRDVVSWHISYHEGNI